MSETMVLGHLDRAKESAVSFHALRSPKYLFRMADNDPRVITLRRSTVVRIGIAVAILAALGIGLAIGLSVRSPSSSPSKSAATTTTTKTGHASTTTTTVPPTTTTGAPPATTTTVNPARQILSPATTQPVVDECSVPISQSADGNPYPTTCPAGGGINVVAWRYIANSYSNILGLGANASEQEAFQTMCSSSVPGGEVSVAAEVAARYYGWSFANDPAFTGWYPGDPTDCGSPLALSSRGVTAEPGGCSSGSRTTAECSLLASAHAS